VVGELGVHAPIQVRAAAGGDLDALVAVSLACARSQIAWAGGDWLPPAAVAERRLWWERLRDQRAWVGVAESAFTCVGCISAWPAPTARGSGTRLAYLAGPLVDPDWWGEGIGSALLDESLVVLAGLRFARAELAVQAGNRRARRFLETRGFALVERGLGRSAMAIVFYARALSIY
jgi:GNAT superfamily N-acetyltransferase